MIIFFIFREFKSQKEKNLILEENKKLLEIKIKERTSELENGKNQLELKIKEIEKINKKLETYSYTISHDLKEPIRSIRTFSEFIQEDYEDKFDDEAKDYFSRIIRASNRMALMIDDLLLISKIAKQNIKFERIEVSSIIKDVKEILNHKIIERNIQINSTDLPEIFCQPTLIQTVFLNLINNSIKYCDKNEVIIDISSKEFDDYYEFSIKDNGVGIPNEQHYKIFELFRKAHQNKNIEGSGAGLTIVNSVIELHNGKIWVDWSEVNKGTIFKFTIYKNLSNF
jgi:light-regulated signal transduction histidine kinase (bacteriophytochrome)